jgi:hypothetical protein
MNQDGTRDLQWVQIRDWVPATPRSIASGLLFGLAVGLAAALTVRLTFRLATGLAAAAGFALLTAFRERTPMLHGPRRLRQVFRPASVPSGLAIGLAAGLSVGLGFGLVVGFLGGPAIGLTAGLTAGIAAGLTLGPAGGFMYSMTWAVSLALVQLAARQRTPVRLVHFLEDARDRNVLRTVGPVYQFRHARLQDRLAGQDQPPE